ncbi:MULTISPECIES: pilin [unclassified Francisella]|uniref:pilin n=1 Tax=unclassified Francisella TaxID=2610885 RepID=UPI002E32D3B1|nr:MULTISPECIES: pilin [unclassified Francisella]MED7819874.1 pilin [Francisella sp. 19S2-4]MED7830708.1 pilin [Francisella sp. 19S2-10]
MKDNNGLEDFYNLEKKLFEATEKQRSREFHERKKGFTNSPSSSSHKSIISKEKLALIVIVFILGIFALPMAQAYLIRSKISVAIQETQELQQRIADSIIFKSPNPTTNNLPEHTSIDQKSHQIKIDIGESGKQLVSGMGYIYLKPTVVEDKDIVKWTCNVQGTGIHEDYLPDNCRLSKKIK